MTGSEAVRSNRAGRRVRVSHRGCHEGHDGKRGARVGFESPRHEHAHANPTADHGAVRDPHTLDLHRHGPAQERWEHSEAK